MAAALAERLPGRVPVSMPVLRGLARLMVALGLLSGLALPAAGSGAAPAAAQAGGGDPLDGLKDVLIDAFEEFLQALFEPVERFIEAHGNGLVRLVVGTQHPDTVFEPPTRGPWPGLYDFYWGTVIPVALFLYGISVGLVILLESTSHLFSSYHRAKLRKRGVTGLFGILSWWWMAALSLRLVHALSVYLAPDLSEITLFQTLSFTGLGILGTIVAMSVNLSLFLAIGLVYFLRSVLLYLFVLLMPLLIAFWIPGVGPFATVGKLMQRFAGFYVPFLFVTVPVAMLLRLAHLLGTRGGGGLGGVGAWLSALVIPFLALLLPFILVWQTGAVFDVGRRAARGVSIRALQRRSGAARAQGRRVAATGKRAASRVTDAGATAASAASETAASAASMYAAGKGLRDTHQPLSGDMMSLGRPDDRADGTTPATGSPDGQDADLNGQPDVQFRGAGVAASWRSAEHGMAPLADAMDSSGTTDTDAETTAATEARRRSDADPSVEDSDAPGPDAAENRTSRTDPDD